VDPWTQDELLAALRAGWPDVTIDAFEPTENVPFLDAAMRVHHARIVMGPHGANLNNVLGARPGTTIIEFGSVPQSAPTEYYVLSPAHVSRSMLQCIHYLRVRVLLLDLRG
jgi:hypothetical protein